MNTRKRKLSEISKPEYLPCDICSIPVYNYEECTQPYTYCSSDCLEVLILSQKNDCINIYKIKRTDNNETIDEMCEDEVESWDSWESIDDPVGYSSACHRALEMVQDIELKG